MGALPAVWVGSWLVLLAAPISSEMPRGWVARGHHLANYVASLDRTVAHSGRASGSIRSVARDPSGFRTLMQTIQADQFRGKRIHLSGFVKTREAANAGLWMRVEGRPPVILAFDNMQTRLLSGTADWKQCDIVLDVPERSRTVAFGFMLTGKGQVWVDDLKLEVVGAEAPTTGLEQGRIELMNNPRRLPRTDQWGEGVPPQAAEPVNLDFEG